MRNNTIICSGVFLLILSICGVIYSARVVLAQSLYAHAKFVIPAGSTRAILDLCAMASRFYGHNYYFCILAAETAYYESFIVSGKDVLRSVAEAQKWCDKGLESNHYRMPLRRLKASMIARTSHVDAVKYWEEFVDWQYWEPSNHAFLVELYALAGQYEKAVESLALIKDFPSYQSARMKLNEAWKKDKDFPAELFRKQSKRARSSAGLSFLSSSMTAG